MQNEGYRQCIVQMLYLMDKEEDNEVLEEIYTIARYHYIKMAPDRRKQIDKCRGIVFRIIAGMDEERVRQLYNVLVGHYRFSGSGAVTSAPWEAAAINKNMIDKLVGGLIYG